jgi:hypothetical protein
MHSAGDVARAVELMRRSQTNYRHFMTHLEDPSWLAPLLEAGYFQHPPASRRDGDMISYPPWPDLHALVLCAVAAPETVAAILGAIDSTDNQRVHGDTVRIVQLLPVELVLDWADAETTWVEGQTHLEFGLGEGLGEFAGHLIARGKAEHGLRLASVLLAPRAREDGVWRAVEGRVEPYEYGQAARAAFEHIPADALSALSVAVDLLGSAAELASDARDSTRDYSETWHPSLDDTGENLGDSVADELVSLVRDLSDRVITQAGVSVAELIAVLAARESTIFSRLILYTLARHPQDDDALTRRWLLDSRVFSDESVAREYIQLAATALVTADAETLDAWTGLLDAGPTVHGYGSPEARASEGVSEADWTHVVQRWKRDRLARIGDGLPPRFQTALAELVAAEGPPIVEASEVTGFVGPTSPLSEEALAAMTIAELTEWLASWEPAGDWMAPSRDGLARVLASVVARSPSRFSEDALAFGSLHLSYVGGLLRGLEEATKAGATDIGWDSVLDLGLKLASLPAMDTRSNEAPWARQQLMALLAGGIERRALPATVSDKAWRVIDPITWDAEPTRDYESQDGRETMDPLTLSLNSVRGQAMHAAIAYGLWAKELDTGEGGSRLDAVRENLIAHLDPEREPTATIRGVFAARFGSLINIDEGWAATVANQVFGSPDSRDALGEVAWRTFLSWVTPHRAYLRLLRSHYLRAVSEVADAEPVTSGFGRPPLLALAEHLLTYYAIGELELDDELMGSLTAIQSVEFVRHGVVFLGRSIGQLDDAQPQPAVLERLRTYWERLVGTWIERGAPSSQRPALEPFGWWFAGSQLDSQWLLRELRRVVDHGVAVDPEFRVIPWLRDLLPADPVAVLQTLMAFLRAGGGGWRTTTTGDEVAAALRAAQALSDRAVTLEVERIANWYVQQGAVEFAQFIRP